MLTAPPAAFPDATRGDAIRATAARRRDVAASVALDDADLTSSVSAEIRAAIEGHRAVMVATAYRGEETDAECEREAQMQIDAEHAVARAPTLTLADLRAKLVYLVPIMTETMLDRDYVDYLGTVRDDVDRLCREVVEYPRPSTSSLTDLGQRFDDAHDVWRGAVEAAVEPNARYQAAINAARVPGRPTLEEYRAASRLPGVEQAVAVEQAAFDTVSEIGLDILRRPARSVADLAVQARGAIPLIWGDGSYEADVGPDEDINNEAVRLLIESCCAVAGVDWRGRPHGAAPSDPVAAAREADRHDYAFHAASTELRLATRDHERLVNAADDVWIEQNGGDTSAEAMAPAIVAREAASARQEQAWRDLFKIRPRTWHQLWLMLRDVAEHFDSHQGMVDEPDVFGSLIGAVNGLRISSTELTAAHDLSLLSINELEYLADIFRHQSRVLAAFEQEHSEKPLGVVLDTESNRLAILGDHARHEIARRRPTGEFDRDLRLESMIKADLAGNGYVEPALLAEAVAAWGAR